MKRIPATILMTSVALLATSIVGCGDKGDAVGISASGTIEAETIAIASQQPGRVLEVLVDEGDEVEVGDVLVRLDPAVLDAGVEEARAAVDAARAELDALKAGARPEELRMARAALAGAVARWNGARLAWENARAMADDPQELEAQLAEASTQVSLAETRVDNADEALAVVKARATRAVGADEEKIAAAQLEAARATRAQAGAALAGAMQALDGLKSIRVNPIAMRTAVNAAQTAFAQAESGVEAAQAKLDLLEAGATRAEIDAAQSRLEQAEAALEALLLQRDTTVLTAPSAGFVMVRSIEPGEYALPGAVLLRIGNLDSVKLVVFVSETDIGEVHLGQAVDVEVDAFEDEKFEGEVTFISSRAEFTPRNVQTQDQRANLVFAVTVSLSDANRRLLPGMPADATIVVD